MITVKTMRLTFVDSQNLPPAIFCNFTFTTQVRVLSWAIEFNFKEININIELNSRYTFGITNFQSVSHKIRERTVSERKS